MYIPPTKISSLFNRFCHQYHSLIYFNAPCVYPANNIWQPGKWYINRFCNWKVCEFAIICKFLWKCKTFLFSLLASAIRTIGAYSDKTRGAKTSIYESLMNWVVRNGLFLEDSEKTFKWESSWPYLPAGASTFQIKSCFLLLKSKSAKHWTCFVRHTSREKIFHRSDMAWHFKADNKWHLVNGTNLLFPFLYLCATVRYHIFFNHGTVLNKFLPAENIKCL